MSMDDACADSGGVSAGAARAYALIAAGENVPAELAGAVGELVEAGFVTVDAGAGNRPVALKPDEAALAQFDQQMQQVRDWADRFRKLPRVLQQLSPLYEQVQPRSVGGSEYIDDPTVVNARLEQVVSGAREEILAAQPGGPRRRELLDMVVARDTAALERGVRLRTLYRSTVRDNAVTAEYVRRMCSRAEGRRPEYATLTGPFERCIVIDRRVAFIENHLVREDGVDVPEHAAWQITDPAMVAFVAAVFEAEWRRAEPWYGELRTGVDWTVDTVSGAQGVRTTQRQREIMRDQCAGIPQQVTARRLGVSVRTIAAELKELRARFGAETPMQLAYKWTLSPDRHVDDSVPGAGTESGGEGGAGEGQDGLAAA